MSHCVFALDKRKLQISRYLKTQELVKYAQT